MHDCFIPLVGDGCAFLLHWARSRVWKTIPPTHTSPVHAPGPLVVSTGSGAGRPVQSRALARCLGNIHSGEVFIFVVPARLEIVFAARQTAVVIVSFAVRSRIMAKGGSRHEHLLAWQTVSRTFERAFHNPPERGQVCFTGVFRACAFVFLGCLFV